MALAVNLKQDITHLTSHKYIAHQLALLYQSINYFRNYMLNMVVTHSPVKSTSDRVLSSSQSTQETSDLDDETIESMFHGYRERIEKKFEKVKAACSTNQPQFQVMADSSGDLPSKKVEVFKEPYLSPELKRWMLELCHETLLEVERCMLTVPLMSTL